MTAGSDEPGRGVPWSFSRPIAERRYRRKMGVAPNLDHPTRLSAKIHVAKLTWRSPLMPLLVDKAGAKALVARHLGPEWVTPSLYEGNWLPPRAERTWPVPFVIKINRSTGANIFVRSDADLDWPRIERRLRLLKLKRHWIGKGEWAYSPIRPRVLVEPFIAEIGAAPIDYKFFVFGGRVEFCEVHVGRYTTGRRHAFFDRDWQPQPFHLADMAVDADIDRPASLDAMIAGAEEIGRHFPFLRVDLYEIGGKPRFGEATFYPDGGFAHYEPEEYDEILGALFPPGQPADRW